MKRKDRPRVCWVIEHLPDLWLFGAVTPAIIYMLFSVSP